MSDPVSTVEIEDVLSSIRRLVSEEGRSAVSADRFVEPKKADRLVLTPALRVTEPEAPAAETETPDVEAGTAAAEPEAPAAEAELPDADAERQSDDTRPADPPWKDPAATLYDAASRGTPQADNADAPIVLTPELEVAQSEERGETNAAGEAIEDDRGDPAEDMQDVGAAGVAIAGTDAADAEDDAPGEPPAATAESKFQTDPEAGASEDAGAAGSDYLAIDQFEFESRRHGDASVADRPDTPQPAAEPSESATGEDSSPAFVSIRDPERAPPDDTVDPGEPGDEPEWSSDSAGPAAAPFTRDVADAGDVAGPAAEEEHGAAAESAPEPVEEDAEEGAVEASEAAAGEPGSADPDGRVNGIATRQSSLTAKIEALEEAIGRSGDHWEPDGETDEPYSGTTVRPLRWAVPEPETPAGAGSAAGDAPAETAEDDAGATLGAQPPAEAVAASTDDPADDEAILDEASLRALVAEIVREELQGPLGERITRNVRKLVRREIQRALAVKDLE